ncbi:MAG: protoheme IX farnesyltransferase [Gammaproteobacteria bacterium]|nr:protoheme IX farnesyltransferase [Gammaproteobacteria bacterium]MCP4979274.1 protoheme IX farnesyltransferase [Gammaproteobacteria bacterium]
MFGQISNLLKLRIGVVMMLTALVAMAITPGQQPSVFEMLVLAFAVLISAGSAGAFNQYFEVDLDSKVARTCNRPFVTGYFHKGPMWLGIILLLLVAGVGSAALVLNVPSAIYIFLGAFFYAIVYTVWLKRRSWTNIIIGGASGSFAVLAGAAAVDPDLGPVPIMLALVLFFWTPSHFWSLAIAKNKDYTKTGVPMLPVIIGNQRCAKVVMLNTLALVATSIMPFFYGMSWIYLLAAAGGGGFFIYHNYLMIRDPSPRVAMKSFFASLLQLVLLLVGAVLDVILLG